MCGLWSEKNEVFKLSDTQKNCTPTVPCSSFFWGAVWDKSVSLKPAQVLPSILIHLFGQDLEHVMPGRYKRYKQTTRNTEEPQLCKGNKGNKQSRMVQSLKISAKTGLKLPSHCTSLAVLTVAVQSQIYKHMQTNSLICIRCTSWYILHLHLH